MSCCGIFRRPHVHLNFLLHHNMLLLDGGVGVNRHTSEVSRVMRWISGYALPSPDH